MFYIGLGERPFAIVHPDIENIFQHPLRYGHEKIGDGIKEPIEQFHCPGKEGQQGIALGPEQGLWYEFPENEDKDGGDKGLRYQAYDIYIAAGIMDLQDKPVPEGCKGFAYHQAEDDQADIIADQGSADELGGIFHEMGKDDATAKSLLFLQLDGQLIGAYERNFDPRKKSDHKPSYNDPDKGISIDHAQCTGKGYSENNPLPGARSNDGPSAGEPQARRGEFNRKNREFIALRTP